MDIFNKNAKVELFSNGPKDNVEASPISMILKNSDDAEVGEIVRQIQYEYWQKGLEEIISKNAQLLSRSGSKSAHHRFM